MDMLARLRALMDEPFDPTNQYARYGLKAPQKTGDVLSTGLGALPGIGDALAAKDAVAATEKGDYKEALFNSLGALPMIPAFAGAIRSADKSLSFVPPKVGPAESDEPAHLAKRASDILKRKHAQVMGTEADPIYDLFGTEILDSQTFNDYVNQHVFMHPLKVVADKFGVPAHGDILDLIRQDYRLKKQSSFAGSRMEDSYDRGLASYAEPFSDSYQEFLDAGSIFAPHYQDTMRGMAKNPDNFNKMFFQEPAFTPFKDDDTRVEEMLLRKMQQGKLSPQAVKDVRFGVPELFKWLEEDKAARLRAKHQEHLDMVETAHAYPDGYQWVKVAHPKALEAEGTIMKHCVGDYCDQVDSGFSDIWSLRDENNMPHVTVETSPATGEVRQVFGKANSAVKEQYQPYVDHFEQEIAPNSIGKKILWQPDDWQI